MQALHPELFASTSVQQQHLPSEASSPEDAPVADCDVLRFRLLARKDCDLERDHPHRLTNGQILKLLYQSLQIDDAEREAAYENANSLTPAESLDSSTDEANPDSSAGKGGSLQKQSQSKTHAESGYTVVIDFVRSRSCEESVILGTQSIMEAHGFAVCIHNTNSSQSSSSGYFKESKIYFKIQAKDSDPEDVSNACFILETSEQPTAVYFSQLMLEELRESLIGGGIGDYERLFQSPSFVESKQIPQRVPRAPKFYSIFGSKTSAKKSLPPKSAPAVLQSPEAWAWETAPFDRIVEPLAQPEEVLASEAQLVVFTSTHGYQTREQWLGLELHPELRFNLASRPRNYRSLARVASPVETVQLEQPAIVQTKSLNIEESIVQAPAEPEPEQKTQPKQKPLKPSGSCPVGDRYLKINGVDLKLYPIKEVCNLFNHYGDIEKAFYQESSTASLYFRYSSPEGAHNTVSQLKNLRLKGMEPRFEMLGAKEFDEAVLALQAKGFTPRKRFSAKAGATVPNTINPISKTVHISFYREGEYSPIDEEVLRRQIEKTGVDIVRLKRENKKSNLNMWFLECRSIEEASRVLLKQHNKFFLGGSLRVSFTRNL